MNMRMKSSGRLRSSGSIARSISGRAKTRKIEDNRPLSEAYRVLQQKMGDCPPSPVFSCVPGYGGERTSPHSSVAQGEGVVQRKIEVKGMEATAIEGAVEKFILRFPKEQQKALRKEYERLKNDTKKFYHFLSIKRLFWKISKKEEGDTEFPVRESKKQEPLRAAPGINPNLNYLSETETHVGFEIELGKSYFFPLSSKAKKGDAKKRYTEIDDLTNKTLAVFYMDEAYLQSLKPKIAAKQNENKALINLAQSTFDCGILEMLIDDVGWGGKEGEEKVKAQVEFRTPPLKFGDIDIVLKNTIVAAIEGFSVAILARSGMRMWVASGYWESKERLPVFPEGGEDRLQPSGKLVQHATISIEPEAFAMLREEQQKVLVPYLAGCRSVKEIFDRMAMFVKDGQKNDKEQDTGVIDATTTGRNKAGMFMKGKGNSKGICFKTPLEAIFAASSTLSPPDLVNKIIGNVTVGEGYSYTIQDFVELKKKIIDSKKFPRKQGENEVGSGKVMDKGLGYRVVAEKLQPLFLDQTSGIPRILIEYRGGALRDQINSALNGVGGLEEIIKAVKDMDDYRQILQPDGSRKLSSKQLDDIKRQQNYVEKQKQREEDIRRSEQEDKHRNEKVLLEPKQDIALYGATTYDQLDDQLMKLCDTGVKKSVKVTIPDRVQKNPSVFGTNAYMMLDNKPTKLSGSGMKNSGGKIPGKAQESSDMLKTVSHGMYSPQGPFGVSGVKKGQSSIKEESRDQGKLLFVMGAGFSVLSKPKGKEKEVKFVKKGRFPFE